MTVGYELYKVLIKKKAIVLIILGLIIKVFVLSFNSTAAFTLKAEESPVYREYISTLAGELNESKEEFILNEYDSLKQAQVDSEKVFSEYSSGEINYAEFNSRINYYKSILEKQKEIEILYARYLKAVENPDSTYFILQNGWNSLLAKSSPDFIMLIVLVLMITPVFCMDTDAQMLGILSCCENGRKKLCISKILTGIILSITVSVLFFCEEIIYYSLKYGLHNSSFPIQSISQYEDSSYKLSLCQLSAITLGNIIVGCVMLSLIVMAVSVISKDTLSASFTGAAVILLSYFLFDGLDKYKLPLPMGFLISTGYLQGIVRKRNFAIEQDILSKEVYFRNLILALIILALLCAVTIVIYTPKAKKRKLIN